MSVDFVMEQVKDLLNLSETDMYDRQLTLVVSSAMNKLETEGVKNIYEDEVVGDSADYIMCVSYQAGIDMGMSTDLNNFYTQYVTRVNTLRAKQSGN